MSGRNRRTWCSVSLLLVAAIGCGAEERGNSASGGAAAQDIAAGEELFRRSGCAVCHGEEGRGDGATARNLVPRPRNLHEPAAFEQGTGVEEIARTIETGVPGTMPGYPYIPEKDRRRLALFIRSLQEQP